MKTFLITNKELLEKYPSIGQFNVRGKIVNIPSFYRGEGITAVFPISYNKATELINSDCIKPARLSMTKSLINITVFRFFESPVGPYNELVITIPVFNKPLINFPFIPLLLNKFSRKFGFHVLDIFQSTNIAVEHGNLLTGYPHNKSLIDLNFRKNNNTLSVDVYNNNGQMLILDSIRKGKRRISCSNYMTYYEKNDHLFQIQMDIYATEEKLFRSSISVCRHPLASILRDLNVSGQSIQSIFYPEVVEVNPVTRKTIL